MNIDAHTQSVTGHRFMAKDAQGREWECAADYRYEHSGKGQQPYALNELIGFRGWTDQMAVMQEIQPCDLLVKALENELRYNGHILDAEENSGKDYESDDPMDNSREPRSDIDN